MGFTYNDTASADMGIKARLTSWQAVSYTHLDVYKRQGQGKHHERL